MSLYEQMCNEIPNVNILASNEEMVANMRIANWKAPIYNISGLSFGKTEVQSRVPVRKPFEERKMRVIFGARWDQEKQPGFFMDMIRHWKHNTKLLPEVEFAICCGGPLRSNNQVYVDQARMMEKDGTLKIYENLKKNEYYNILADSRVLLALTLMAPMASYALSVDVENDLTVRSGDTSVLVDQDKNKLQVKYGSLSLYKSDDVQLGTELDVIDFSGLTGSIHYEYTEDNDSVVGLSTGFSLFGINLDTKLDWNVNETEFDGY